jgi:hypothetical protein
VVEAAKFYLQRIVNEQLQPHTSVQLLMDRGGRLRRRSVPRDLLGCFWLQLARAIDGERDYRQCPCGLWFELGPTSRPDRLFHSNACRQAHYRERLAQVDDSAKRRPKALPTRGHRVGGGRRPVV